MRDGQSRCGRGPSQWPGVRNASFTGIDSENAPCHCWTTFIRRCWGPGNGKDFYGWWAVAISDALNQSLPADYFAEFQVKLGSRIEADVGACNANSVTEAQCSKDAAIAVQTHARVPPTATAVMPAVFPDDFEIQVFSGEGGPILVAAIELVSPANKDRGETRRAFAAKCAAYLQRGIGLIVIDIVTSRHANLHDELVGLLAH